MYAVFENQAAFDAWHSVVKTALGLPSGVVTDYTTALPHPTNDTVAAAVNDKVDQTGLTLINKTSAILSGYVEGDVNQALQEIVRNAIDFFNGMMIKAAAENIAIGITQQGKTKEVADYLSDVMRYGQSGSLYEVINEIDSLIAATVPPSLSPFVNEERLLNFKQQILDYLS